MTGVFHAFAMAFGQLGDRSILSVLARSVAITLAAFVLLGVGAWYGFAALLAHYGVAWNDTLGALGAILLTALGGWLLFRLVALAVLQFFADDIVKAVEARHYPDALATRRDLPFADDLANSMGGLLRALVANLVALPFALLLLVTGVGTAILFWAVNAWLLGRELTDMVRLRHRASAESGLPLPGLTRFALGGIVAALMLVPFANLLAPVIGAATATHLVHSRKTAR
ncbi:EI24 domain-containing protein [Tsuneonella mangrovi]|uniref:EI24 domain-containing protein n=1 Tax=Tsuneonella mangrovi TaxID=1982042 RepID=UPI000BA28156|nr:EI24 domain-containing protein [Tsuneonella mangrovi]